MAPLIVALAACGSGASKPQVGAGEAAAVALTAAIDRAAATLAPWRCATLAPTAAAPAAPPLVTGGRTWQRRERGLVSAGATLTVVAVADARGAADAAWRERLRTADADLVISLGGMGTTEAEIGASLGALVDPAWLTVAIPGSTEAWPAHRAAIAALAAGGAAVVDGADVRLIDGGAAVLATLPGQPFAERLAAGADGCLHDDADVAAVVAALHASAADRPRLLVSPRAAQLGAGDRVAGGVHAGDPGLAPMVVGLVAVIHAPLALAPITSDRAGDGTATIAAGSLDPVPRFAADGRRWPTSAAAVTIDHGQVRWRALALDDR